MAKTVVLIDDEKDLREMMAFQLEAAGYEVFTAANGTEGLKVLDSVVPDLVILDINMPEMSGLEFYKRISTEYGKTKFPVLVCTARANLEDMFRGIAVDGFISKPFEIEDFLGQVANLTASPHNQVVYIIDPRGFEHVGAIMNVLVEQRYAVLHISDHKEISEKALLQKPDFILMEYMQKGISGDALIADIRSDRNLSGIPVIVYTYSGFCNCREKALEAGADLFIGKPENELKFVEAIKKVVIGSKE